MTKHVTTYDEFREAIEEARDEIEELIDNLPSDFRDTEKLVSKLERLLAEAKPRKAGK